MKNYASHIVADKTVANNAGGQVFKIDCWAQLDRFCVLGVENGSYYASEKEMVFDNVNCIVDCLAEDGVKTVGRIVEISQAGRAPKNDPAIFSLAMCFVLGDDKTKQAARAALPKVCRTGTHLFQFISMVDSGKGKKLRGWGPAMRKAVSLWYNQPLDRLALQAVKYRQRADWTHRDALRMAHPLTDEPGRKVLFDWICGREVEAETLPGIVQGYVKAQTAPVGDLPALIRDYNLPREALPTEALNDREVWRALMEDMPLHAMVRNLGKLSSINLIGEKKVKERVLAALRNREFIRKSRLHPLSILIARSTYATGHGDRGKLSWTVDREVDRALDDAFYLAFDNVEPTGKRIMIACDVSGSMGSGSIAGSRLTPREGCGALALVTARTESNYMITGFTSTPAAWSSGRGRSHWGGGISPLAIQPRMRLDDVTRYMAGLPFGGTDCALPMLYSEAQNLAFDAFIILTDSETWANPQVSPAEALRSYRKTMGINAKLIVVGMTATRFSISDPSDPGMLDVAGFDTAVPSLIEQFIRS